MPGLLPVVRAGQEGVVATNEGGKSMPDSETKVLVPCEPLAVLLDSMLRGERGPVRSRAYALATALLAGHDPDELADRVNVILRAGRVPKLWRLAVDGGGLDDEEGDETTREAA